MGWMTPEEARVKRERLEAEREPGVVILPAVPAGWNWNAKDSIGWPRIQHADHGSAESVDDERYRMYDSPYTSFMPFRCPVCGAMCRPSYYKGLAQEVQPLT